MAEIEFFSSLERRRLFHLAFERRFRTQTLDAISVHTQRKSARVAAPRFQAVFCLDEREESMRRHLEEIAPETETFGTAGFFSAAIYYRGAADAHFVPLCPVVIRPQHWVVEDVVYTEEETHLRRAKRRTALGTTSHQVHVGSRSFAGGALLTASLGVLASFPLVARVLFPRLTAMVRRSAGRWLGPPSYTQLRLERTRASPGPVEGQIGFTVDEMAHILDLTDFQGLYEHTPTLAVCFAMTGLASVGFPGTTGFVATELLVDGAVATYPHVGVAVVLAAALNGIAVVRTYFLLFAGTQYASAVSLRIGTRERFAVLSLAALILGGGLFPQPTVVSRHHAATEFLSRRATLPPSAASDEDAGQTEEEAVEHEMP